MNKNTIDTMTKKKIFHKKSQDMSVKVIVGGVFVLLLIIIYVSLETGSASTFQKEISACESKGNICTKQCPNSYSKFSSLDCSVKGEVCCLKSSGTSSSKDSKIIEGDLNAP